jgi:ubiquinone/menaquinone biosynthesis C-methylase UbiE
MADTGDPIEERKFLPALRWKALTPAFDTVVRITAREHAIKQRLLDQAAVRPGDSVLDLGSGTGTLALWLKQRCPEAGVMGLDADPDVLALARRKAAAARCDIEFVEGFSTELPFPPDSFDTVLSTLFFHHLTGADKRGTLAEVVRVLKPSGQLHVADWGKPSDPAMAALFYSVRLLDGFEVTADNVRGALPALFEESGLEDARERNRLRTALGTLALYSARKPEPDSKQRRNRATP